MYSGVFEVSSLKLREKMTDRVGLGPEVRELKLGPTFTNNKSTAFHTLKYDFKPASVDVSKIARVDVKADNTISVTVPHLDGAGIPHTVFKGSTRPYNRECVLIIDRVTGEVTLEKLSSNIQVKKTRTEPKSQPHLSAPASNSGARPNTPVEPLRTSPTHGRNKSRTKVSTGKKREPSVQLHPKPHSPFRVSPYHGKSPSSNQINHSPVQPSSQSTLASLPMIGFDNDDFSITPPVPIPPPVSRPPSNIPQKSSTFSKPPEPIKSEPIKSEPTKSERIKSEPPPSDSSSSSSSSDSSDSESDAEKIPVPPRNDLLNGMTSSPLLMPDILLNDDLQLSESESDSD